MNNNNYGFNNDPEEEKTDVGLIFDFDEEKWNETDEDGKMTWADLAVVLFTTNWMERIDVAPFWEDYPLLNDIRERIEALPQRWFREMAQTPTY
ncbi:hypothetical protein LSH36_10g02008 [Paralvinella palmiformis]|uniref:Glutathione S-transferase C-terminal domain-containing protein n=1 Tax=Paralvinella palmiformis TaxID=53620 RepID=A0AAD9KEP6_9ANNE|nr:hypothetical protein LSH36_10g02008 [Paralvinella palmiformis]